MVLITSDPIQDRMGLWARKPSPLLALKPILIFRRKISYWLLAISPWLCLVRDVDFVPHEKLISFAAFQIKAKMRQPYSPSHKFPGLQF
jgi:hypothetical protein